MKKYVGLIEVSKRDHAMAGIYLVTIVGAIISVALYQDRSLPAWGWMTGVSITALLDLIFASIVLFPRTYLTVDLDQRVATFFEEGTQRTIPLAELGPLYLQETRGEGEASGAGMGRRIGGTAEVRTSAVTVVFYSLM